MDEEYRIRQLEPDETGKMKRLARRSFGVLQGVFVKPTDETYVCELDGEIVGVIALATFRFKRDRSGGVVKWLYTDPVAQGRGVAAELVSHGVSRLRELGCDELFTTVEGYKPARVTGLPTRASTRSVPCNRCVGTD